ncbi:MAG: DUF371 domain-containing protein [Candidatus Bathyarchaeia archaeon]
MKAVEVIYARGHENVLSTHKTTFQITKEPFLSKRGDCVIAVAATKGARDLSPEFKETARRERARITVIIEVDRVKEVVKAQGSARLTFTHQNDLVVRKSSYACGRTLAVQADKAAKDLSRRLVEKLRKPEQRVKVTLIAETTT